jgi:hypothetical protein
VTGTKYEIEWRAAPPDIATCMYYTGQDPFTKQPVYVARDLRNRKLQRALMQFFKPETTSKPARHWWKLAGKTWSAVTRASPRPIRRGRLWMPGVGGPMRW